MKRERSEHLKSGCVCVTAHRNDNLHIVGGGAYFELGLGLDKKGDTAWVGARETTVQ